MKFTTCVALGCFSLMLGLARTALAILPFQAQVQDQSAYALGKLDLNIIFVESNGAIDANQENWTPAQLTTMQAEIGQMVSFWEGMTAGYHPNARLDISVNYVNGGTPLTTGYEPITRTTAQEGLWINQVMSTLGYNNADRFVNVRNFNQARRVAAGTHWAATVFIVNDEVDADNMFNGGGFAYAYHGGPFSVLTYANDGWGANRFDQVLSHEFGHIVFAHDEYAASGRRNNERGGYLNGINGNAELDSNGNPVVPPQPNALMLNNTLNPSSFSKVQWGHVDTDGDTIPDILDTFPVLNGSVSGSDPSLGNFVFSGLVQVTTLNNLNPLNIGFSNSLADMTISTIQDGEYRLDGGAWTPLNALDGLYDEYDEQINFSLLGLSAGLHTIDIRSHNNVDNPSNMLSYQFVSTVPEPSTLSLAGLGILGLALAARKRRRMAA